MSDLRYLVQAVNVLDRRLSDLQTEARDAGVEAAAAFLRPDVDAETTDVGAQLAEQTVENGKRRLKSAKMAAEKYLKHQGVGNRDVAGEALEALREAERLLP